MALNCTEFYRSISQAQIIMGSCSKGGCALVRLCLCLPAYPLIFGRGLGSCLLLQFLVVRQQQEATFWGIRLKICLSTKVFEDFNRKGPLYTLSLPAIQNKFFICTLDILRVHKGPSILDVLLCQYPRNKKKLTGEQSIIWWFSSVYEAFLIFQLRRFFRQFISFE